MADPGLDGTAATQVCDEFWRQATAGAADQHAGFALAMAAIATVNDGEVWALICEDLHLYAIAMFFAISSNQSDRVPSPSRSYGAATKSNMVSEIVKLAGISLNLALETSVNEPQPANRVFSPQN